MSVRRSQWWKPKIKLLPYKSVANLQIDDHPSGQVFPFNRQSLILKLRGPECPSIALTDVFCQSLLLNLSAIRARAVLKNKPKIAQ